MRIVRNTFVILLALAAGAVGVSAQPAVPAQPAPAKVGVVRSAMFSNTTGGITRYVNAIRTLDAEFKSRRDEITQLVARFEALQKAPANETQAQLATRQDQAQTLQIDITRKQEDARTAYTRRFGQLTDPIQKSIVDALTAFAKARGIDVLIDASKFTDGLLLVNEGADITAAFIRDFNSKNP